MKRWNIILAAALAAGCAGGGDREASVRAYDLGGVPPTARLAPAKVGVVRAGAPFDTPDMLYRLAYRDAAEVLAFAQHRWAAAPAVLLQRQFARASGAPAGPCTVDFEIHEALQVFASKEASEFVLEGRGLLVAAGGARAGERVFRVVEREAGGTAAGGARAFARAADRLVGEVSAWAARVPACRAG